MSYDSDLVKEVRTFNITSNIGSQSNDNFIDSYEIISEQHNFWSNLKTQVLDNNYSSPVKNLPTLPTLGNTVGLYSFGNDEDFNVMNCQVYYVDIMSDVRKVSFKLIKTDESTYVKSDSNEDVQVIWVINGDRSFVKVLWDEVKVSVASIKEIKVGTEVIRGEDLSYKYLKDDDVVIDENSTITIDVLSNDNLN